MPFNVTVDPSYDKVDEIRNVLISGLVEIYALRRMPVVQSVYW